MASHIAYSSRLHGDDIAANQVDKAIGARPDDGDITAKGDLVAFGRVEVAGGVGTRTQPKDGGIGTLTASKPVVPDIRSAECYGCPS